MAVVMFSWPNVPDVGIKLGAASMPSELASDRATAPFQSSPYSRMPNIQVSVKGIEKLLKGLNPHKASGLKPIVLQTIHKELAPILQLIYQRSLDAGKLQTIWKEANVSPIFKKGGKTGTANY